MLMIRKNCIALRGYFILYIGSLYVVASARIYHGYSFGISDVLSNMIIRIGKNTMSIHHDHYRAYNHSIKDFSEIGCMFDKRKAIYAFICRISGYENRIRDADRAYSELGIFLNQSNF